MAVERPLKEGNVRTYQEKVGLGFLDILASEADADFDTIYAAWNGGVDTAHISDNAVTSAKIAVSAVGTRELADNLPGAILASETLQWTQCVPGFSIRATAKADGIANAQTSGAEVLLCTLPSMSPRAGAFVLFLVTLQLFFRTTAAGDLLCRLTLKRGATAVWTIDLPFGGLPVNSYVALPPLPAFVYPAVVGPSTYAVFGEVPSGSGTLVVGAAKGYVQAFEFA